MKNLVFRSCVCYVFFTIMFWCCQIWVFLRSPGLGLPRAARFSLCCAHRFSASVSAACGSRRSSDFLLTCRSWIRFAAGVQSCFHTRVRVRVPSREPKRTTARFRPWRRRCCLCSILPPEFFAARLRFFRHRSERCPCLLRSDLGGVCL
jgi:hypothetical protein